MREVNDPRGFWTRSGREGYSREAILKKARAAGEIYSTYERGLPVEQLAANPDIADAYYSYFMEPVRVSSIGDYYVFESDGRHRILAAQELDVSIPVLITGSYEYNGAVRKLSLSL